MDYYAYKKVNDEDGIINAGKSNQTSEGAKGKIEFKKFSNFNRKKKKKIKTRPRRESIPMRMRQVLFKPTGLE
jgi:hypothetical protein